MSIKNFKPSKKSIFKQGYYDVSKSTKYVGQQPCIYRSSYEQRFIQYCETNANVIEWSSEPFAINYKDLKGNNHKYYIDFYVKYKNGKQILVEVKPFNQTVPTMNETYVRNSLKWKAATEYCNQHGLSFVIVTERTLKKMSLMR